MEGEYDFTDKSEQEVLLSYVAHKGHRTRYVNKIASLLDLQEAKYSKVTEATLMNYVHQMERHQDRLNIFSAWLTLHELKSAQVHTEEAENLEVDTTAIAERVLEGIHNYVPPPAALAMPGVNSGLRRQPSLRAPNKKVAPNATAP